MHINVRVQKPGSQESEVSSVYHLHRGVHNTVALAESVIILNVILGAEIAPESLYFDIMQRR